MHLKTLHIRNFRNFLDETIFFHPKINLFIGENGQGKSNLLEAVYFLSTGRSFRSSFINELIHFGKDYFLIEAEIEKLGVSEYLRIFYDKKIKKIQYNSTNYSSFSQLFGVLPAVLMTPQDIDLIISSPSIRRRFLNLHIAQHDPLYIHHLTRYWKAMKERNAILKKRKLDSIEIFEKQMLISACYLTQARQKGVTDLQETLKQFSSQLKIEKDTVTLEYVPSCLLEKLAFNWQKNRDKEMMTGSTFYGPHRDDFSIDLNQKKAKHFASEGQKRIILSLLKYAEWKRLCNRVQLPALMGFDDFGMHLDPINEKMLESNLQSFSQVFITSPCLEKKWQITDCHTYQVKQGQISI
ncbi:MAG: hypothetical protein COT84_05930 [Chlamydiae bacterium CG10_big_fil_rev_8_21_14_0_10_35_9]|nr:MAG: hypothetical protein COT84_05930 [Chlamydiae bacterium CG10_big_fil_rev_8_21_14_0_10_35_9]